MNAETRAHWYALSVDADLAATRCCFCHQFGHRTSGCPSLGHLTEPGVTVERAEQGQQFSKAFDVLLIAIGVFSGLAIAKLLEVFWR